MAVSSWRSPPVLRLPPELLLNIFSLVASFKLAHEYCDDDETIPFLTSIAVSQVCRDWRRVALECRPLWAAIPLQSTQLAKLALERSHNHPLLISGNFEDEDATQRPDSLAVKCAFAGLGRAFEVSLEEIKDDQWSVVSDALTLHLAPLLETLSISSADDRASLPENIFQGTAPASLESLCLQFVSISPYSKLLHTPSLCYLHLEGYENSAIWSTIEAFMDAMSRMPLLETLRLAEVFLFSSHALHSQTYAPVTLHHLQVLALEGSLKSVVFIVNHISAPLESKLDFSVHVPYNENIHINDIHSSVLSLITPRFPHSVSYYDRVRIERCDDELAGVLVTFKEPSPVIPIAPDLPVVPLVTRLEFISNVGADEVESWSGLWPELAAMAACARMIWEGVVILEVLNVNFSLPQAQRTALGLSQAARTLHFEGQESATVFLSQCVAREYTKGLVGRRYFLDRIRELHLEKIDLTKFLDDSLGTVFRSLIENFSPTRNRRSWGPLRLKLSHCVFSEEMLTVMQQRFGYDCVEWK